MTKDLDNAAQLALLCGDIAESDLAYCAGLFDGEGSITISGKSNLTLTIEIANSHKPTIDWLKRTFGGHIYEDSHVWAIRFWKWVARGTAATRILQAIEPYLKIKSEEAKIGIAFEMPVKGERWHPPSRKLLEWREEQRQLLRIAKDNRVQRRKVHANKQDSTH